VGGLFAEAFIFIFKLEKYTKIITYIFLLIAGLAYTLVWIFRDSNILLQLILLFIASFFLACPCSRISASDPV
jgi:cation transport ATPase